MRTFLALSVATALLAGATMLAIRPPHGTTHQAETIPITASSFADSRLQRK